MQTESNITNIQYHHQEFGGGAMQPIKDESYN